MVNDAEQKGRLQDGGPGKEGAEEVLTRGKSVRHGAGDGASCGHARDDRAETCRIEIDGIPEEQQKDADPYQFVADVEKAGDGEAQEQSAGVPVRRKGTEDVTGALFLRLFLPGERKCQSRHKGIAADGDHAGAFDADDAEQHTSCAQNACGGAQGVHGIDESRIAAVASLAGGIAADDDGYGGAHERRRYEKQRRRQHKPDAGRLPETCADGGIPCGVALFHEGKSRWNEKGGNRDAEFQQSVEPDGTKRGTGQTAAESASCGETGKKDGGHHAYGREAGTEHQTELPHPDQLIDQAARSGNGIDKGQGPPEGGKAGSHNIGGHGTSVGAPEGSGARF